MINSLRLDNFKLWKKTNIKFSPLTGFFGTNSSGKTSILQALLLLKQTVESSDRAQVLNLGNENTYVELGSFKDVISDHDFNQLLKIGIDLKFDTPLEIQDPENIAETLFKDDEMFFSTTIGQTPRGRVYVERLLYEFSEYQFSLQKSKAKYQYSLSANSFSSRNDFTFKRNKGRSWPLPEPVKFYGFRDQVNAYFRNTGFLDDLQLTLENQLNNIYYLGPLREHPKRRYTWAGANPSDMGRKGEMVVDAMLASKVRKEKISRGSGKNSLTLERIVAEWLQNLDLIHSFRVSRIIKGGNLYEVLIKKSANSTEVPLTDMGFGVSQILPVITLCFYAPKGSTLIIEQPEIHLHPFVQAGLADLFIEAIKYRNVQIILESHSEHLLKRIQRRIAEETFSEKDACLYFCQPEKTYSELITLKLDEFGNISNWPVGFFGDEFGEIAATSKAILNRQRNG